MIYLIQAISILFAITLAKHDGPAVSQFEDRGFKDEQTKNKWMAVFHRYNNFGKFLWCVGMALIPAWHKEWVDAGFAGLLAFLWIYLIFDPVLNISRTPKRDLYYLGQNDSDGRRWIKWFGQKNAGKAKAILLSMLVAAANFIHLKINH